MAPVCTIMVRRVDDWLKVVADRDDIIINPEYLEWAGIAVMKNAYALYRQRDFRTRLQVAAYRNHHHWSQFIGADRIATIPYRWAVRYNGSDLSPESRIDDPVDPAIVNELLAKFEDFGKAYHADGMTEGEFDTYGATVRTLRGFITSYVDLVGVVREIILPNPDL